MIGLLLATAAEAEPLWAVLAAVKVADDPFVTYRFAPAGPRPGGVVVLSGIGRRAAAAATEHLLERYRPEVVVNVGLCGALSDRFARGALVRIAAAVDGDRVLAGEDPEEVPCAPAWSELPPARLASVDEAIFDDDRRARLARRADVVDMEGLAVASVCRCRGVPAHLLKGVSDLADGAGKADIRRNIQAVSARLAEAVAGELDRLGAPRGTTPSALARFVKIEHSVFSLPLLFAGAYLGAGGRWPSVAILAWVALAGVAARTLGMTMNRILDRRLDALNRRTAGRELPSGRMSLAVACGLAGAALVVYLIACAALGPVCLALSPVPAAVLIVYSLLKRFTSLCHFGIGLCLALAPLGAFVAASGTVSLTAEVLLLAAFTFCWMSGFDIIYGLMDIESDRATGVRSVPAALGSPRAQVVAAGVHLVSAGAATGLWWLVGAGVLPGIALAVTVGGFAAAYWPRLPIAARFFPTSAVVGIAASMIPFLGDV